MKSLEELDPSSLDSIEFNIKSVKKYTSIFTIVLSLFVIILSIVINAESLSQLYISRKFLPVTSTKFKQTNSTFTDQPICVVYPGSQNVSASLFVINQVGSSNVYTNKSIPASNSMEGFGYMLKHIGPNAYQCFNLKGETIRRNDQIRLFCSFPPGAKVLIGAHSIYTVLKESDQDVIELDQSYLIPLTAIKFVLTVNQFILKERLQVNYEPQVLFTLNKQFDNHFNMFIPSPGTELVFTFNANYVESNQNYIGISYTITRDNIAEILGNLLAWRGLILIPIAITLMLFPVVEKFYKFDLIKARLQSKVIENTSFGIMTDIKRRLTTCCPNRFKDERVINKAIEKIDEELDLIAILQMQSVMRRQRSEFNQIEREEDIFDCKIQQKDVKMDLLLQNSENREVHPVTRASLAQNKIQQIFQRNQENKKSLFLQYMKSFIYSFDSTQTSVSISTNQGKGYGSIWSLLSFIFLGAAIVACLLLLGVFNVMGDSNELTALGLDEIDFNITVPKYKLAFRVEHLFVDCIPKAYLVDSDDQRLQEVSLSNDSQCADLALKYNAPVTDNWYCVNEEVKISSFPGNSLRLLIAPSYFFPASESFKNFGNVKALIISERLGGQEVGEFCSHSQGNTNIVYTAKKIAKIIDGDRLQGYELKSAQKIGAEKTAAYFVVSEEYSLRQQDSGSYWNIFNDTWGIVIIACELVLFRVGRMINMKILSARVNTEKQEKRSDILTVLFDIDRLSKGIYNQELSSVGFYYKYKLPVESS